MSSNSAAIGLSSPRNHAASGTAKPCLRRFRISFGNNDFRVFLKMYFPCPSFSFREDRDSRGQFHKFMVEDRTTDFQRVGHAGAIDFYQDVINQVSFNIEVLQS